MSKFIENQLEHIIDCTIESFLIVIALVVDKHSRHIILDENKAISALINRLEKEKTINKLI